MNEPGIRYITPDELRRVFGDTSAATLKRNAGDPGLRTAEPERLEGMPLERREKREGPRAVGATRRARVVFRVWSQRPADWDNYLVKYLQDGFVHAGILDGDAWNQLSAEVISEKVHKKSEEKTEVTIERI